METVEHWKICLCLFVAVFVTSLEYSTEEPDLIETTSSNATALFNLPSTAMGLIKSAARTTSDNTVHTDVYNVVGLSTTPSLKNGTVLNNSLENSTVSVLTHNAELSELAKKNEMAPTVTDGALWAGNETQVRVGKPIPNPTSASSLGTKSVNVTVGLKGAEENVNITKAGQTSVTMRVPQQMGTTGKMQSTIQESGSETTVKPKNASPATFSEPEESEELANDTLSAESETLPVLSTLQESKTTPITVKSSVGISTTTETMSTSYPRASHATAETVVTSRTIINKATTLLSAQQSKDHVFNAKKMVDGKPVSNPSQSKMDPLVIGMITVFFIIIGIVSLLGFLKYRQRINQPEFRRLHELPMDDMMEEDTPLSLYSY